MNGIGGNWLTDWWEAVISPHEKAFERVFNELSNARNAVREGFRESQSAWASLTEFYIAFSALPPGRQQSDYRGQYQDIKGELDASDKRLKGFSTDIATVQDIASKAYARKIPYDFINGEVAIKSSDITLREVSQNEAEEATARMASGVGLVFSTGWIVLISILALIGVGGAATAAVLIADKRGLHALNLEIAKIKAAKGMIPEYIEDDSVLSDAATTVTAGVSIATIGLVGLVGWWLAKRA